MFENLKGSLCFYLKELIYKIEDILCFTKKEKEEIISRVNETKKDAENYKNVEENLPKLLEAIESLKCEKRSVENDVLVLAKENKFYRQKVRDLFLANVENDNGKIVELFKELGYNF